MAPCNGLRSHPGCIKPSVPRIDSGFTTSLTRIRLLSDSLDSCLSLYGTAVPQIRPRATQHLLGFGCFFFSSFKRTKLSSFKQNSYYNPHYGIEYPVNPRRWQGMLNKHYTAFFFSSAGNWSFQKNPQCSCTVITSQMKDVEYF